jgi:hypothetical protein
LLLPVRLSPNGHIDHLGHGEEAVLGGGRVGEDLVADAAVGDDVVAQAQLLGMTAVIGSTPETSTSCSCSTQPRMLFSSGASASTSASLTAMRARRRCGARWRRRRT